MANNRQAEMAAKMLQTIANLKAATLIATVSVIALGIAGYALYIVDKAL